MWQRIDEVSPKKSESFSLNPPKVVHQHDAGDMVRAWSGLPREGLSFLKHI